MQNKFINYLFFQWQTQQKPMSQKIGVFFNHKKSDTTYWAVSLFIF
jgi:hypothetical protein